MIAFRYTSPQDFIKPYSPTKPTEEVINKFSQDTKNFLKEALARDTEEFQKNEFNKFLNEVYNYKCNTKKDIDSVIYVENEAQVLIEVKSLKNKNEFPKDTPLSKALCEAVLYFLREIKSNNSIKHIILCNPCEFYIFDAQKFNDIFSKDKTIKKLYKNCDGKEGTNTSTKKFYESLEKYFRSDEFEKELPYTHFSLNKELSTEELSTIYQLLSPQVLLKVRKTLDANTLNKDFYEELLYILGLEEKGESGKNKGKILIKPSSTPHTLSSEISRHYGLDEESIFTLITTWNNRILFLRLLESMLLSFGHINEPFLDISIIKDFKTLQNLFFEVLAKKSEERSPLLPKEFLSIPYLNSSLFDKIPLEEKNNIGGLDSYEIPLFSRSILKERYKDKNKPSLLKYLFEFLHAYDFTTTPKDIEEGVKTNHDKLINSAVLGLVFEKLNGYKEGSFYTPSFITTYMCKESITQAVIDKFNSVYEWKCKDLSELRARIDRNFLEKKEAYRATLLSLKICDPAVGSGHFLVSALNEIILIAHTLGLIDSTLRYKLELENDEILIYLPNEELNEELFAYTKPKFSSDPSHQIQKEIFNLKKSIIENCLFGVDINPNSCEITKLRLWIELLKYSPYIFENDKNTNRLETLPNIDINIKCGNSLISRFSLDDKLNKIKNIKKKIQEYKELVASYKNPNPLHPKSKTQLENKILELKAEFSLTLKDPKTKKELEKAIKTHIELYNDFALDESLLEGLSIREKNLFGTPELSPKEEKEAFASYGKIRALRKKLDSALSGEEYKNAFEWRFEFPEVLDEEGNFLGFDCVIGNPPYIRIQGLGRDVSERYKNSFNSATKNYDIYVLFVEKCLELLTPQAQIAFIMPHKWFISDFGEGLRGLTKDKVSKIISFGHFQVFGASTYTALQWFGKKSQELQYIQAPNELKTSQEMQDFLLSLDSKDFFKIANDSLGTSTWIFGSDSSQNILSKISSHLRVGEIFSKMFQGIATSRDDVYFLYDCQEKGALTRGYSKELDKEVEIENTLLKPLLMGDSFHRYESLETELRVIFPYYESTDSKGNPKMYLYDEATLKGKFPKGYAYLKKCEKVLRGRENGRLQNDEVWWRYIYPKNQLLFEKEKLLCPDVCENMQFSFDVEGKYFFTTTIYGYIRNVQFKNFDYRYLMGVLNSKLAWWYLSQVGTVMRGGYYRIKPAYIQNFTIPHLSPKEQKPFIKLVDEILTLKETNPQADTQKLEAQIDSLVYKLYNLTDEEIEIINRG